MGFLDKFKKKDDFKNLKDPMSDPLGQMPVDPLQSTSTTPADLPPPELPEINDATGSQSFGSSMDQDNTSTSAAQIPSLPKIEDSFGAQRPQSESAMSTGINEQQQSPQQPPTAGSNRDFELINSKLDNIKSLLENLNQRVAHLEQEKYAEESNRPRRLNW